MRPTDNVLVKKVQASGYMPKQLKHPPQKPASFRKDQGLSTTDTKKGMSRAFVSRDGKPISYAPKGAPRNKTLAQLSRSIKNG